MKHRFAVLPALMLAGALAQPSQAQTNEFEGIITMKASTGQGDGTIAYLMRKGRIRMEMDAGERKMVMLVDIAQKTSSILMPEQQMYMQIPLQVPSGDAGAAGPRIDGVKTGKTESIAGHSCDVWIFKDDSGETEVCLAEGFGTFMGFGGRPGGGRGSQPAWMNELRQKGAFPLRVRPAGGGPGALEVTKVEKKTLDESLFTVPSGWSKMGMPGRP